MFSLLAVGLAVWAIVPLVTVHARPLLQQPFPDSAEYADAAWQLGHGHGYFTFFDERHPGQIFGTKPEPPRYPFGTAAALAPFAAVFHGWPASVQLGARVYSVLYVVAIVVAAWLLAGPLAAAVAALIVGLSPFAHISATFILSDPLASLLTILILIAFIRGSKGWIVLAGAAAGALVDVRLLGGVALPGVLIAAGRSRWRLAALAAAPFVLALGLYQWHAFGSPLTTGYSFWLPGIHQFGLSFLTSAPHGDGALIPDKLNGSIFQGLCPCGVRGPMSALSNIAFYPSVLAGLYWVFAPPLIGFLGLVELVRRRASPAARFALVTVALNLAVVLVYYYQAARLVAPAASLLLVYGAVGIATLAEWARRRVGARVRRAALPSLPPATAG